MKKKIIAISFIVVLILALAAGLFACSGGSGEAVNKTIVINEGDSVFKIASTLEEEGIIGSSPWFILRLIISGDRGKLHYGTYELSSEYSYDKMIEVLSSGGISTAVTMLTIPEGYSIQQMAVLIDESEINVTAQEFYDALNDDYNYSFIKDIPKSDNRDYKLQGFLFPSTYEFYIETTAHDIINTMLGEFDRQFEQAGDNMTDMPFYDIVKIASVIEREALLESELPVIAGVINNRLDIDMPLQVDATVVYAVTEGMYNVNSVTYKDLEVDSPYNTYKYTGLPAGPICNPGAAAIKAALNPQLNEYLYYHTDESKQDGSHIFTTTFEEHKNTM